MAVVHPVPPSSSSSPSPSPSSSTWTLEHAGAAASSSSQRRPSAGSDQHNLSLDSEMDYSDGKALIRHTFYFFKISTLYWCKCLYSVSRYAIAEGGLKQMLQPLDLLKATSIATDLYLWAGCLLRVLSTQTCYRSSEWSCGSLRTVPLAIPKESTEGMHMYIHAYIFFLIGIPTPICTPNVWSSIWKCKTERNKHLLKECVLKAEEKKKTCVLQLNGQSRKLTLGANHFISVSFTVNFL